MEQEVILKAVENLGGIGALIVFFWYYVKRMEKKEEDMSRENKEREDYLQKENEKREEKYQTTIAENQKVIMTQAEAFSSLSRDVHDIKQIIVKG